MKRITKTAACKQASAETTSLSPFGNGWKWSWFDHRVNAWRESHPTDYFRAQGQRRRHLIERATEILHPDLEDQHPYEPGDFAGGSWQSYVN